MKLTVITTHQLYFTILTVSSEITPKSEELYSVCWFVRSAMPSVAPYCVRGGVRVVSGARGLRVAGSFVQQVRDQGIFDDS
jgi:hypothetical protein